MKIHYCSVCEKEIAAKDVKKCGNCKIMNSDYLLCSKACQKADYKRHKKQECLHANYDCVEYKELLEQGYEWYKEQKGDDDDEHVMPRKAWVKSVNSINKNIDGKIPYTHGFTHWRNGDRSINGMFNLKFYHVCDVLVMLDDSHSSDMNDIVSNTDFADGLTQEQIDFVKENNDFLWVMYHDTNSDLPIIMIPGHKHSHAIFTKPGFRSEQTAKRTKRMQKPLDNFMAATLARHGLFNGQQQQQKKKK